MKEEGPSDRLRAAALLTAAGTLFLGGLAYWQIAGGAPQDSVASGAALTWPTCSDPVAVAWPGGGEVLGCASELPELLQRAAKEAECRLMVSFGSGGSGGTKEATALTATTLRAGERMRVSVGDAGRCTLKVEMLPGSTLVTLGLPIDLNRARAEDLEVLEAIGPTRARAVVEDREARGAFTSVDELERVSGIGPRTLEAVREKVTVATKAATGGR